MGEEVLDEKQLGIHNDKYGRELDQKEEEHSYRLVHLEECRLVQRGRWHKSNILAQEQGADLSPQVV